jgi:hypothetical protein
MRKRENTESKQELYNKGKFRKNKDKRGAIGAKKRHVMRRRNKIIFRRGGVSFQTKI